GRSTTRSARVPTGVVRMPPWPSPARPCSVAAPRRSHAAWSPSSRSLSSSGAGPESPALHSTTKERTMDDNTYDAAMEIRDAVNSLTAQVAEMNAYLKYILKALESLVKIQNNRP